MSAASKLNSPYLECKLSQLFAHPHNPRGKVAPEDVPDLSASVKEQGVLVPLLVVSHEQRRGVETYLIVAGHRRHVAAQLAGPKVVPIIVKQLSPIEQEKLMLIENLQRTSLSPLQEAKAFERLVVQGATQRSIVRKLTLTPHHVSSRLQILQLASPVQEMFADHDLPVTVIPHLLKVSSAARQLQFARLVAAPCPGGDRRLPR